LILAGWKKAGQSRSGPTVSRLILALILTGLGLNGARALGGASAQDQVNLIAVTEDVGISFMHLYGGPDKGFIMEMAGSGGAWLDYDLDGWMDLLLVNSLPLVTPDPAATVDAYLRGELEHQDDAGHRFFRNSGGQFQEVSIAADLRDVIWGNGVAVGDVDNDGFPDIYVTAIGPNKLYRNNGDGTFSLWLSGAEDPRWGTSAVFTDWDDDGWLDLYVAHYVDIDAETIPALGDNACFYRGIEVHCGPEGLVGDVDAFYRNTGEGSFVPWPDAEIDVDRTFGLALLATDCDGDHQPDLYVATDSTMNLLYRHEPDHALLDWSLISGAGFSSSGREQAGMGVTAADYDGDGDFDLFVTNFQHDYNTLYRNLGECIFDDASEELGFAVTSMAYMGWAPQFFDIDGDGDQDVFVANGHVYPQMSFEGLEPWEQRNLLYINELAQTGEPSYQEMGEDAGSGMEDLGSSRAVLLADYDNDADLDLLITNISRSPTLLQNAGGMTLPALRLSLIGRSGNRSAYGAKVVVDSGDTSQVFELRGSDGYAGSNDPRLLIYLPGGVADRLQVTWRNGEVTSLEKVAPGWLVLDEQRGLIARKEP